MGMVVNVGCTLVDAACQREFSLERLYAVPIHMLLISRKVI